MDAKELLFRDFKRQLLMSGLELDNMNYILNSLTLAMENYDINQRSTEIVSYDNSSNELLKLYAGSLLTEGKSKNTVYAYIRILSRFYNDIGKPLLEVSSQDIKLWLAKQQHNNVKLVTCENYRSYLSAFYQWLCLEEYIEKSPMAKIKPINYKKEIKPIFTDIEIDKLRNNCTTLRQRAEIEFLLASGARVSEICSLKIEDMNLDTREVIIRETKSNKQRIVYMTDMCIFHLRKYLESRQDESPYLFVSKLDNKMSKNSFENEIKKIGQLAEVNCVHPHRFRRHFCTTFIKKGGNINTAQKLLGHTDINTTNRYTTLSNQYVKNEYMRFN